MTRPLLLLLTLPLWGWAALPAHATSPAQALPPDMAAKGDTVVTFTFDGSFKSQDEFSRLLSRHGLAGTFYINSGYLDFPAYLSVDQLRAIARDRNEIAGASMLGNDLTRMSAEQASQEICDDRATLAQLGFQVTSFAYPHGAQDATVKAAVQRCGYNSARRYTGLYDSEDSCSSCPVSETIPATDDFRIRTPPQENRLATLQRRVERAEQGGGGWLPLVFTKICLCPDEGDAISPEAFTAFLVWLKDRPGTTVKTVDQVMGGALRPVHGRPLDRLVPDPSSAISRETPLSSAPAWTVLGQGIGQTQIIFMGVIVSIAVVVTFRAATRSNRHGH